MQWDDESELDLGDGTSQLSSVTPSASSNYNNNRSNGLPRVLTCIHNSPQKLKCCTLNFKLQFHFLYIEDGKSGNVAIG